MHIIVYLHRGRRAQPERDGMAKDKIMAEKRTIISMPDALRRQIREFRFARQFNTEAEAIRTLIEKGLQAEGFPLKTTDPER